MATVPITLTPASASAAYGMSPGQAAGIGIGQELASSAFNAWESHKNRRFQERMSNTAYRRSMRDMRAAGLNPMLAASMGGSTTPPGSAAHAAGSGNVAQSAMQAQLQRFQMDDLESSVRLKNQSAWQANNAAEREHAHAELMRAQTANTALDADRMRAESKFWSSDLGKMHPALRGITELLRNLRILTK